MSLSINESNYFYMIETMEFEYNFFKESMFDEIDIIQEKLDIAGSAKKVKDYVIKFVKYVFDRIKRFVVYYKNFLSRITGIDKMVLKAKYEKCKKIYKDNDRFTMKAVYRTIDEQAIPIINEKLQKNFKAKRSTDYLFSINYNALLNTNLMNAIVQYALTSTMTPKVDLESTTERWEYAYAQRKAEGFYFTLHIKELKAVSNAEDAKKILKRFIFKEEYTQTIDDVKTLDKLMDDYDILKKGIKTVERISYDTNNILELALRNESQIMTILNKAPLLNKDIVKLINLQLKCTLETVEQYRTLLNVVLDIEWSQVKHINSIFDSIISHASQGTVDNDPYRIGMSPA